MKNHNNSELPIVLVTGAAGFVGSFLCEELIKKHWVIGLDNFITGSVENLRLLLQSSNFIFLRHDLTQPLDLEQQPDLKKLQLSLRGIKEVYHLACPTSPKDYDKLPLPTILANSHATKNALDIAVHYRSKFFHASTSAVYGDRRPGKPYFKEGYWGYINPLGPRRAYEEGKRFAESLVLTYRDTFNLPVCLGRIFPSYGPRMRIAEGHIIPDLIKHAILNEPVIINGDDQMTTSYCYIGDTVGAIIKLMEVNYQEPINIGNPQEHRLVDIAQKIISLTNSSSAITYGEPLPFLTHQGLPDISLIKEKLGWFPLVSLDEGLKFTIDYMRSNWNRLGLEDVAVRAS